MGSILIFTILISPIHERGIVLHLLVSSLISFISVLVSLGRYIPNYFIIFVAMVNGIVSLISFSTWLQQYVNRELPDVQAGFRKGRGTRDQIANNRRIIEKAREFQKNIYFCFLDYAKAFDCVDHNKLRKILKRDGNTRPPNLPLEKSVCRSGSNS